MDVSGTLLSANRYMPYGELRTDTSQTGISETDLGYTGQRNYADFVLKDYNARVYNHYLNQYQQPDRIKLNLGNQTLNRNMYVFENRIILYNPSGVFFVNMMRQMLYYKE